MACSKYLTGMCRETLYEMTILISESHILLNHWLIIMGYLLAPATTSIWVVAGNRREKKERELCSKAPGYSDEFYVLV